MSESELRELLKAAMANRLAHDGWQAEEGWGLEGTLAFSLRLNVEFRVVAVVLCGRGSKRGPLLVDNVSVGVCYEPLRRLYPLLGASFCRFLPLEEIDEELPREAEDRCLFELRNQHDVDAVAERLSELVGRQAVPAVQRYATADALIDRLGGQEDPWEGSPVLPAVLAAAGRLQEAATLLDERADSVTQRPPEEDNRVLRQLRRWIRSGGDMSLVPPEPPPSPYEPSDHRPVGELWNETRVASRAREAARAEVHRTGAGKSRAEQRALLEQALARRGHHEPALWIEQTLDHLWDSPVGRAKAGAEALKEVGRIGRGLLRAVQTRTLPDPSPPEWMQPPAHACYELITGHDWIEVDVVPEALEWLGRVHEAALRIFNTTLNVTAWLDYDADDVRRLAVHIGAHRVGRLSDHDACAFTAAMHAARLRDELPTIPARLSVRPRPVHYLLEVAAPSPTNLDQ